MGGTSFIAISESNRGKMLETIGVSGVEELFSGIPDSLKTQTFDIPEGVSELDMMRRLSELAGRNAVDDLCFCGAGYYDHFIPAAVDMLAGRGEFYTAYTPYQPEASQGTLQAIYEYQTAMARLTGMDVSNASLYDGGTALFEAMMMAVRETRRSKVVVDEGVNPIYRTMIKSYTRNLELGYVEVPLKEGLADRSRFEKEIDDRTAAVLLQNPNFFGCADDLSDIVDRAHQAKALAVISVYPVSLSLLKTPGEMGADIATGEGQSLGLPLGFGGPYLGFMCARKRFVRKLPGRIAGATQDEQGRRGYVLTLQAREQHIRREKATSNICTNQGLCALRAAIYLSLLGKQGFVELGRLNASAAAYAYECLTEIDGVKPLFQASFFNEFSLQLPLPASRVVERLSRSGITGGFTAGRYYEGMDRVLIVAVTEQRTRDEVNRFAEALRQATRD